jgi:hypothetical protein
LSTLCIRLYFFHHPKLSSENVARPVQPNAIRAHNSGDLSAPGCRCPGIFKLIDNKGAAIWWGGRRTASPSSANLHCWSGQLTSVSIANQEAELHTVRRVGTARPMEGEL